MATHNLVARGRKGGKKAGNNYIILDEPSAKLLGRKHLGGKTVRDILKDKDFEHLADVVVLMQNKRKVLDIVRESEFEDEAVGAVERQLVEEETHAWDALQDDVLEPPEGMFPCVPEPDPDYVLPRSIRPVLSTILELLKVDTRVNFLLTGPQGTGKTTLAQIVAEELGWDFVKVECGAIREPGDWFTRIVAKNGSTYAIPTQLMYAITKPRTVILLDEINRTNPANHNSIYGLLDELAQVWSDDLGCYINRAPQVLVIGTANVEETNVGVFEMDSALLDRFPFQIELTVPGKTMLKRIILNRVPGLSDDAAGLLTELAERIKDKVGTVLVRSAGVRPFIAAAKLMLHGLGFEEAATYTVAQIYSKVGGVDSDRAIVESMISGLAANTPNDKFEWDFS